MRNSRPVLIAAALVAALAQPATSLVIDNFEETNFSFTDDVTPLTGIGPTFGENSGMSTANVVGGVRLVRIIVGSTGAATAAAALVTTPVDDAAALTVAGVPDGTGDYEFIYDGVANGSADGRFGTLNLDLTPFTSIDVSVTHLGLTATMQLALSSSTSTSFSPVIPMANGINSFLLSGFTTLDLTDINQVRLLIAGIDVGEAPLLNYIQTEPLLVPEPATGTLIALGLVGIAIRRRSAC
jgi:PEP-CTERM motif